MKNISYSIPRELEERIQKEFDATWRNFASVCAAERPDDDESQDREAEEQIPPGIAWYFVSAYPDGSRFYRRRRLLTVEEQVAVYRETALDLHERREKEKRARDIGEAVLKAVREEMKPTVTASPASKPVS